MDKEGSLIISSSEIWDDRTKKINQIFLWPNKIIKDIETQKNKAIIVRPKKVNQVKISNPKK